MCIAKVTRSLLIALALSGAVLLAADPPQLSEVEKLRAELHSTKVALLQAQEQQASCQIKMQALTLSDDQRTLEKQFRETLRPPEHAVFNWQLLKFEPPK